MECQMRLHFIHVAGTRMIEQGTDGLSRGELCTGVMGGKTMLSFIPLHESAVDREPELLDWVTSWTGDEAVLLTPEDWFGLGHDIRGWYENEDHISCPIIKKGTWLWSPPPEAADIAVEQLRYARMKRTKSLHVFLCPRLMQPRWRRHLHKVCDVVLECEVGQSFWKQHMHEPLIIGLCFPYLSCEPWQARNFPALIAFSKMMRSRWKEKDMETSTLLQSCLKAMRKLRGCSAETNKMLLNGPAGKLLAFGQLKNVRKRKRGS